MDKSRKSSGRIQFIQSFLSGCGKAANKLVRKSVGKLRIKISGVVGKLVLHKNSGKSEGFARDGGKVLQVDLHIGKQIRKECFPHFPHSLLLLLLNII